MRLNVARDYRVQTHEGGPAVSNLSVEQQLRRSVLACLLWEDTFYESGQSIADRISDLSSKVKPEVLASLAYEARTVFNLRHVPLLLLDTLTKTGQGSRVVSDAIAGTVQRVDDMPELLAIYWRKGKKTVSAQLRKGLAKAFPKFNEYQLAKYDRSDAVKLRDVIRIARPKPKDDDQSSLWKRVVKRELKTPDTWEVELSAGKDKKETFERLIRERKLGYFALLRNLRNMVKANVDVDLVRDAIVARKGGAEKLLPFRYIAAARAAPQFEPYLDQALCEAIAELPVLQGKTIILVDVSGSMEAQLSGKSDLKRVDAAAALGAIVPGDVRVFTFSGNVVEVPPRRGMAGVDAIVNSQDHGSTYLGRAVTHANTLPHDRLIVISDEQSHDPVPAPKAKHAYMINVSSHQNGVGYREGWNHIDGFSESILRYISAIENERESVD